MPFCTKGTEKVGPRSQLWCVSAQLTLHMWTPAPRRQPPESREHPALEAQRAHAAASQVNKGHDSWGKGVQQLSP